MAVGLALAFLVELALRVAPRQAPNGNRLAAQGIPMVLEMEESAERVGKTNDQLGGSGVDPQNELGEPALGSTPYPWGIAQTRYRSLPSHGSEVHGATTETTLADVACFP